MGLMTNHVYSGLSGGIVSVPAEHENHSSVRTSGVVIYHIVEDIEAVRMLTTCNRATLIKNQVGKQVRELGGTVVTAKEPEGKNGWHMHLKDVAGNRFAIYQVRK